MPFEYTFPFSFEWEEEVLLFRGPIENYSYDSAKKELELSGRGMEQLLARYYTNAHPDATADVMAGRLSYSEKSIAYIIEDLLRGTPVTLGTVDVIYTTATASFRFDFISRLEAINQVAEAYGARYWVDENSLLWFRTSRGTTAPVWLRDNIVVTNKIVDFTNLYNKMTVLGKGDGTHQLKVTRERTSSQDNYGLREGVETRRDIIDEDVLIEYTEQLLDITSEPTTTFRVTIPYTPSINVGDMVKVTDKTSNIDGSYKVVELRGEKDTKGKDDITLSLSSKAGRFEQLELWSKLRTLEKSARGSSMVLLYPSSVTAGTALVIEIYMPEESEEVTGILYLDKALVNIEFSAGTASLLVDSEDRSVALGGPWGSSPQIDLDITQWVDLTGWHTVETKTTVTADIRSLVKTRLFSHGY